MKDKSIYYFDVVSLGDRWFNWQQPACPLFLAPCFIATGKSFRDTFKIPFFSSLMYFRTLPNENSDITHGSWILRLDEGRICGQYLIDIFSSNIYKDKFSDEFRSVSAKLLLATKSKIEIGLSDEELVNEYIEFNSKFQWFYTLGSITEPIQWMAESILQDISGSNKYIDKDSEVYHWDAARKKNALLSLTEKQYINEIEESLYECVELIVTDSENIVDIEYVEKYYRNNEKFRLRVNKHASDYEWKQNNYHSVEVYEYSDVLTEISDILRSGAELFAESIIEAKNKHRSAMEDREKLLASIAPYFREIALIQDQFGSGMADRRKKTMLQVLSKIQEYAVAVSERCGLDIELVKMSFPDEIPLLMENSTEYEEKLVTRKRGLVIHESPFPISELEISSLSDSDRVEVVSRSYCTIVEGEQLANYFEELDRKYYLSKKRSSNRIVGEVAYRPNDKDKLTGTVRVVRSPLKAEFIDNEILVASSTTPDFMGLIRKASAIVTDQSGLTTHAALTGRELGIPCVVGTSSASHLLKSGDQIEIDFESGEIKVVNG